MSLDVNSLEFREHFTGGDSPGVGIYGVSTAIVGQNGWSWEVGSTGDNDQRVLAGEPNHPGIALLRVRGQGTGAPAFARLSTGGDEASPIHISNLARFRSVLRVREPDGDGDFTDEGLFTGFGCRPSQYRGGHDLGGDCVFFSGRPGTNAKWQAGCQVMDPETYETSATMVTSAGPDIAINTWYVLEGVQTAGSWEFFIDGLSIGTVDTNVPNLSLTPQYRIVTQMLHETGYMIQLECDEFAYRLDMSGIPTISGW